MRKVDLEAYGTPNPNAPKELAQFAFLIGTWRGEGTSWNEDGTSSPYQMKWVGRYILDGYAIADEARILDEEGELKSIFISYRFYDRDRKRWIIEAFNVLESTIVHKSPHDPEAVQVSGTSIKLMVRWPNQPNVIGRESFIVRTADHFTYRLDVSANNGKTWIEEVDVIEAERVSGE